MRSTGHRGPRRSHQPKTHGAETTSSTAALMRIAEADRFHTLGLLSRDALWAIKGLPDSDLPLFGARDRASQSTSEEPAITLLSMPARREVVEDYSHTDLSFRQFPVAFLRDSLLARRIALVPVRWPPVTGNGAKSRAYSSSASASGRPKAPYSSPLRTRPASPLSSSGPRCSRPTAAPARGRVPQWQPDPQSSSSQTARYVCPRPPSRRH